MNTYTLYDNLGELIYKAYTPTKIIKINVNEYGYKVESWPISSVSIDEKQVTEYEFKRALDAAIKYLTNI